MNFPFVNNLMLDIMKEYIIRHKHPWYVSSKLMSTNEVDSYWDVTVDGIESINQAFAFGYFVGTKEIIKKWEAV